MTDCIVVGAGISGMLTALELRKAGMQVLLLDRQATGLESSWAGGGILSPLYPWRYSSEVTSLAVYGRKVYADLINECKNATGLDPELENTGMLVLDAKDDPVRSWCKQNEYSCENVDSELLRKIEPMLGKDIASSWWLPDVSHVRNPRLVKSLKIILEIMGVEIKQHMPVDDIVVEKGKVIAVRSAEKIHYAANVVITMGAWSRDMLKKYGHDIDVRPVKGQMVVYKTPAGTLSRMILKDNHYVIPRRDGHVLVGSTLEFTEYDKSTSASARQTLEQVAKSLLPGIIDFPVVHHWAGLRPGSPAGIPYIDKVESVEGLFINAGQYRNGVILGPASARLVADLVLERKPAFNSMAYKISAKRADIYGK